MKKKQVSQEIEKIAMSDTESNVTAYYETSGSQKETH